MLGAVDKLEIRNQVWICLGSTYIHVSLWKSFRKQHLQVVAPHTTMELVNYLFWENSVSQPFWHCFVTSLILVQSAIFLREGSGQNILGVFFYPSSVAQPKKCFFRPNLWFLGLAPQGSAYWIRVQDGVYLGSQYWQQRHGWPQGLDNQVRGSPGSHHSSAAA